MNWQIIDTKNRSGNEIMEIDSQLLQKGVQPTLHFYSWHCPTATYGYFVNPDMWLKPNLDLDLVKRPTGGGIIFHEFDFAFSIFIPSTESDFSTDILQNYLYVNQKVATFLEEFTGKKSELLIDNPKLDPPFCMARPTKYDILIEGKKAVGAAQRKTKRGFLHQGSISINKPDVSSYVKDQNVFHNMAQGCFLLEGDDLGKTRKQLREGLVAKFVC